MYISQGQLMTFIRKDKTCIVKAAKNSHLNLNDELGHPLDLARCFVLLFGCAGYCQQQERGTKDGPQVTCFLQPFDTKFQYQGILDPQQ